MVFLLLLDIDLTKQLATRNALLLWVSLIPAQFLALLLLFIFYNYCHVWKKEGVVVGFAYDNSLDVSDSVSQSKFKGHWVTHMKSKQEASVESLTEEAAGMGLSVISKAVEDDENAEQLDLLIQTSVSPDPGDVTGIKDSDSGDTIENDKNTELSVSD